MGGGGQRMNQGDLLGTWEREREEGENEWRRIHVRK
jgi:hypothetical protein